MLLDLGHKSFHVWNSCMQLGCQLYQLTGRYPSEERFGLAAHTRKTMVSVISNIAEGAARSSSKERRRFYEIARSSLVELDGQLELAVRLNFN